jgi:O-antigen ligase
MLDAISPAKQKRPFAIALLGAGFAFAAPSLLASGQAPMPALPTELLAVIGWGALLWVIAHRSSTQERGYAADFGLKAALALLMLLVLAALCSAIFANAAPPIIVRQTGVLVIAAMALLAGATLMPYDSGEKPQHLSLVHALLVALLLAGAVNAVIAVMQYALPGSTWIPLSGDGRAVGHLRQPNHLATQLLWALVALAALRQLVRMPSWLFAALGALLIAALAMTGSRTGALACLLPAAWGLFDRRLTRSTRCALIAAPLLLALCWWALTVIAPHVVSRTNLATTRGGLWLQALRLIEQNPWFGVGWGQFNFAWTLTPMEPIERSAYETFTHAHNLFLQWAVELGLPLAVLLTALLLWALWRALQLARHATGAEAAVRSAALVMVAVVLLHSQLEFPLWHTNFLLPTMCLFGLALSPTRGQQTMPRHRFKAPSWAGGLLVLAGLGVLYDYQPIANLYAPPEDGLSQEQRIDRARLSVLFGHFGDRFAGTLARAGERKLEPYREIIFEMLDLQLLKSWAVAQAETGHVDRARYLAARIKEFKQPQAQQFFDICSTPKAATAFQCTAPPPGLTFRDFR